MRGARCRRAGTAQARGARGAGGSGARGARGARGTGVARACRARRMRAGRVSGRAVGPADSALGALSLFLARFDLVFFLSQFLDIVRELGS